MSQPPDDDTLTDSFSLISCGSKASSLSSGSDLSSEEELQWADDDTTSDFSPTHTSTGGLSDPNIGEIGRSQLIRRNGRQHRLLTVLRCADNPPNVISFRAMSLPTGNKVNQKKDTSSVVPPSDPTTPSDVNILATLSDPATPSDHQISALAEAAVAQVFLNAQQNSRASQHSWSRTKPG